MFQKLLRHSCLSLDGFGKIGRAALVGRYSSATVSSPVVEQDQNNLNPKTSDDNASTHPPENPEGNQENSQSKDERRRRAYLTEEEEAFTPYRYVYPEFLPDPNLLYRNRIREKLERMDMLRRRSNIEIPEFYVGSILSVTVSDQNAPGKSTTFVGIVQERAGAGLRSSFTLRNVVDGHGVEIAYDMYNPTILNITCLRLEKRLDESLRYLRDAPAEYSTFPFDMVPELRNPDAPVPINPMKVKLNPKPWTAKWHLWDLKGIEDITPELQDWEKQKFERWKFSEGFDVKDMDLIKIYRETIPAEEQTEIYGEVHQQLANLTASLRKQKKKRSFAKPQKMV